MQSPALITEHPNTPGSALSSEPETQPWQDFGTWMNASTTRVKTAPYRPHYPGPEEMNLLYKTATTTKFWQKSFAESNLFFFFLCWSFFYLYDSDTRWSWACMDLCERAWLILLNCRQKCIPKCQHVSRKCKLFIITLFLTIKKNRCIFFRVIYREFFFFFFLCHKIGTAKN